MTSYSERFHPTDGLGARSLKTRRIRAARSPRIPTIHANPGHTSPGIHRQWMEC